VLRLHEMTSRIRALRMVGVATSGIAFLAALWLFLPALDQAVGFLTGHALRLVQNHVENRKTVRQIVLERFRDVRWQAYHRDYLGETYVRCDGIDRSGSSVVMVWVVMTIPERRGLACHVRTIATAHTKSAFKLAPSLYEPGHTLYASPDYANW